MMRQALYNALPDDRPITSLQVVENQDKCPPGYTVVSRTHDQDSDADLWREASLFGRKATRYICLSKSSGSSDCVVEAVAILNEKDFPSEGFSVITRTVDTDQKAWRKRQLCYRLRKRNEVSTAITDVIILSKSKKAPEGFSLAGEINGLTVCFKRGFCGNENETANRFADLAISPQTPKPKWNSGKPARPPPPAPGSVNGVYPRVPQYNGSSPSVSYPVRPAPKPPTPSNTNYATLASYSELDGVPFIINPHYQQLFRNNPSVIQHPVIKSKTWEEVEREYHYDFSLERQT